MTPSAYFFVLLLSLFTSACATIQGSKQTVLLRTEPRSVEIYHEGVRLGTAPVLTEVPRQRSLFLDFQYGKQREPFELKAKYRWQESFLGNLMFLSYAPVAWLVDLWTGAAWEYPEDIKLKTHFAEKAVLIPKRQPTPIAIAPPLSSSEGASAQAGDILYSKLHERMENGVFPYRQTAGVFESHGYTFDHTRPENLYSVYNILGVSEIYFSYFDDSEDLKLKGEIKNIFDPTLNRPLDFPLSPDQKRYFENYGVFSKSRKIFSWLPNALFLEASDSRTKLETTSMSTTARTSTGDGLLGEASRYISALSLRNILIPPAEDSWRFRLRFLPTASFSYAKENFADNPTLATLNFTRTHLDIGYVASLNYGGDHLNFYLNLGFAGSYNRISTELNNRQYQADATEVSGVSEAGVTYFFRKHWVLRAFSRTANVPISLWDEVVSQVSQGAERVKSASLLSSGIAIGYCFTPADFGL